MTTIFMAALMAVTAHAEDDEDKSKKRLSVAPIIALATYAPPGGEVTYNAGLGARVAYDITPRKFFGIATSISGSYTGLLGQERSGREWRAGLAVGPRIGTKPGKLAEISLTLTAGVDAINDTYQFASLATPRVPQAWLVNVPFRARAVFALVDAEIGLAPSFFLVNPTGGGDNARVGWDGSVGDEFEWTAGLGVRLGSAFRVGLSARTRETGYGQLRYIGFGLGVGT